MLLYKYRKHIEIEIVEKAKSLTVAVIFLTSLELSLEEEILKRTSRVKYKVAKYIW